MIPKDFVVPFNIDLSRVLLIIDWKLGLVVLLEDAHIKTRRFFYIILAVFPL